MSLDELRKRIDELDEALIKLLNERTNVALEIGKLKKKSSTQIYVPAREKAVLDRVAFLNQGPLKDEFLHAIYREIMSACLSLEREVKIAYLGPRATFTHQAARLRFGASVEYEAAETIRDVFQLVEKQSANYGVVPIENSTEGAVTHTLDEFVDAAVEICAEIYLPISHHLLARGERTAIKRIYSNPQVFGQCRRWLHENMHGVDLVSVSSTAKAAEMAAEEEESGALASQLAAELYGLRILERDVQDLGGNTTRFLVIAQKFGEATGRDKTSILFGIQHKAGALYETLGVFRANGINMTKIESRPSKTKAWEYYFFVDVEGHARDEKVCRALEDMSKNCSVLRVLGSYPQASE